MALPPAAAVNGGIDGVGGGEFYTAVGPDGKEIILRRYLNDQGRRRPVVDCQITFRAQLKGWPQVW